MNSEDKEATLINKGSADRGGFCQSCQKVYTDNRHFLSPSHKHSLIIIKANQNSPETIVKLEPLLALKRRHVKFLKKCIRNKNSIISDVKSLLNGNSIIKTNFNEVKVEKEIEQYEKEVFQAKNELYNKIEKESIPIQNSNSTNVSNSNEVLNNLSSSKSKPNKVNEELIKSFISCLTSKEITTGLFKKLKKKEYSKETTNKPQIISKVELVKRKIRLAVQKCKKKDALYEILEKKEKKNGRNFNDQVVDLILRKHQSDNYKTPFLKNISEELKEASEEFMKVD